MLRLQNSYIERFTQQIRSVFTEQSVRSSVLSNSVAKENEQRLKNVKPQEAQTARSDDPASGNRLGECLQNFETLKKNIQFQKLEKMRHSEKESLLGCATRPLQI